MKRFIMSALALSASACSSNDAPAPLAIAARPTVELVAVTVTGLAPMSPRPNLSLRVLAVSDMHLLYQCPTTVPAATLPSRFWIPGSYKGDQGFFVVLTNDGRPFSTVFVDPQQFAGTHRFNIGSGSTDLTVEVAF